MEKSGNLYRPVNEPTDIYSHHASLECFDGAGSIGGLSLPRFSLIPRIRYPYIDAALRFSAAQNYRSQTIDGFTSSPGLLDKIHPITVGEVEDSLFLTIGAIEDLTLGQGLIVDHFRGIDNARFRLPAW